MIDRVGPLRILGGTHAGDAVAHGITAPHRSSAALPEQAATLVAALGLAPASTVAAARVDAAALAFVREARALAIGGLDRSAAEIDRLVIDAARRGEQAVAALSDVGFDDSDRATTALSTAARILADTPALPLVPSTSAGDR